MNTWLIVVSALFSGGTVAAVLGYLRDRRRAHTDGWVAEETKELKVDAAKLADLEKRFDLAVKAFDAERASKDRIIGGLQADNADLHRQLEEKDAELAELRERIDRMQQELAQMAEHIDRMRGAEHEQA